MSDQHSIKHSFPWIWRPAGNDGDGTMPYWSCLYPGCFICQGMFTPPLGGVGDAYTFDFVCLLNGILTPYNWKYIVTSSYFEWEVIWSGSCLEFTGIVTGLQFASAYILFSFNFSSGQTSHYAVWYFLKKWNFYKRNFLFQIRELNLYQEGDRTHYGQELRPCFLQKCWDDCMTRSEYFRRKKDVDIFNRSVIK